MLFFHRFAVCLLDALWGPISFQAHLIVKKRLSENSEYFTKLCTIINTWRSATTRWRLYEAWQEMFPESPSLKVVNKAPPAPLKGRWGYVEKAEEYLLALDITELRAVTN